MGKKVYVGNLSYSTTNEELSDTFSQFGTVESARIIMDRDSGRSKGFGFVEMASEAEASRAIKGLHGVEREGRPLTVNEAKPQGERTGSSGRSRY